LNLTHKPGISTCGTFHTSPSGEPLYSARFSEVLAFHNVDGRWIAPIQHLEQAFHIDVHGNPIYAPRFRRCFGFYDGLAAVYDANGFHHIRPDGSALYTARYQFAGNYQEGAVVVMQSPQEYFHLGLNGMPLHDAKWQYCGDFRDGIAVVQSHSGLHTHINKQADFVHGKWFHDLDVYHKGFARAKTSRGWCHIDKYGNPIYTERFSSIEPFYNGQARCETYDGTILVINEQGMSLRQLRQSQGDPFSALSADMVGYWKTFTIATAVELGVFDHMPHNAEHLSITCGCNKKLLIRLMKGLEEMGLVCLENGIFTALPKGQFLATDNTHSLASAAIEYSGDLLQRWEKLPEIIRTGSTTSDIFNTVAHHKTRITIHHNMLASYALRDYAELVSLLPVNKKTTVFDAGGGTGTLATLVQETFPEAKVITGDLEQVINKASFPHKIAFDLFDVWPVKVDLILLARILHDWSDTKATEILKHARAALLSGGRVVVIEMLLDEHSPQGALCDLHLLSVSGGKERTLSDFKHIASKAGLEFVEVKGTGALVSVIEFSVAT